MIRAIRIRLYPTPDQKKYLAGLFGAVRFCFNKALYLKTHFYKVKGVNLHPIHDLKKLIAIAKNTKKYAWLAEYDCMALQESVRNLNKTYSRFFKKEAGYPRFKEALQKPLFPSRIEQNCSVRFFFTTSKKWCFFCH